MDPQKASRIRAFLLKRPIEQWLAEEVLLCLPNPHLLHPHLKKALLLRRLSSDLSCGPFSEDTLQCLELLDELDRSLGAAGPPKSLFSAYCAVAVHLTVAPLRRGRNGAAANAGFLEAVHSVWDCRVAELERSESRGMVGKELRDWRMAIKEAARIPSARDWLLRRDTKWEAVEAVREYLRAALKEMGQPLLELVAMVACGEEEAGGGDGTDRSGRERPAAGSSGESNSERRVSPRPQTGHPASVIGTEGSPRVTETGTNKANEHSGQTERGTSDQTCELQPQLSYIELIKAKKALKHSFEELQKVVVDPLPAALEKAADVQACMAERSANASDARENQNQAGVSGLGSSAQKDAQDTVVVRNDDEDLSGSPRPTTQRLDPMCSTARTDKGAEDSNECPSGRSANSSKRTRLSTRNRVVSPSTSQEVSKFVRRRKIKRWTPQEEGALREAVKKHGKGNWKLILHAYPEAFGDRTEVDLKDKWRNMTR